MSGVTMRDLGGIKMLKDLQKQLTPRQMLGLGRVYSQIGTESTMVSYDRQADPETGQRWAPRKTTTTYRSGPQAGKTRRVNLKPRKTLIKSGMLRRSSVFRPILRSGKLVLQGLALWYGEFHHGGTKYMAARRFLGFWPQYLKKAEKAGLKHLGV